MTDQTLSILLALDEQQPTEFFLDSAKRALSAFAAFDLHLLTVVDSSALGGESWDEAKLMEAAKARLHATAKRLVSGLGMHARHVIAHERMGQAAHEILRCASDLEVDLIFVGTHGRKGLQRLVVGSVAERVVREATRPVLVFRAEPPVTVEPVIEPPCPNCAVVRRTSAGRSLWCEQHLEVQGRRHTYFQRDRVAEGDGAFGTGGLHL